MRFSGRVMTNTPQLIYFYLMELLRLSLTPLSGLPNQPTLHPPADSDYSVYDYSDYNIPLHLKSLLLSIVRKKNITFV